MERPTVDPQPLPLRRRKQRSSKSRPANDENANLQSPRLNMKKQESNAKTHRRPLRRSPLKDLRNTPTRSAQKTRSVVNPPTLSDFDVQKV